ncbi:MAG: hypothetical protein CMB79_24320 [Filomicrobium sp.]|nr:hypothetical protein [Filomicrobium sp.]
MFSLQQNFGIEISVNLCVEMKFQSKIVPVRHTVRLAHFVGQNVNLVLLNKFRDRFTFQLDAPSASI